MNNALEAMLDQYDPQNNTERKNAVREILQEIALSGLSRTDFFRKAAFYGGSCLRIFYGLNRFSEDLDFALLEKDPDFKLDEYLDDLRKEFISFGIDISVETQNKKIITPVQSAFIKGNTLMLFMSLFPKSDDAKKIVSNQKIKIKLEIDTENPAGGKTEYRYRMLPSPFEVQVFDEPTLFAGKIHAILCREYKNHVKGRDYYDYLFYAGRHTAINIKYLENKLRNSGKIDSSTDLSLEQVKQLLENKFNDVNYQSAKEDVSAFIHDKNSLMFWKPELFISTLDDLRAV
ncbi:MAG: nucleotidyl transferase AbiEii/AbiGii toxin family protein [Solobacterium sp.]|nr:nucleotidyl transferase AbiEii/AbiGii toxin family protein [Solobacterium sp.]